MRLLNGTSLELDTSSTSAIHWATAWDEYTPATPAMTPGSSRGATSSATTTTIIAGPSAGSYRSVEHIQLRNAGAAANTLTIVLNDGADRAVYAVTLQGGEACEWHRSSGVWVFYAASGRRIADVQPVGAASVLMPPHFATANLTGVKTITSASSFAVYLGKAPRAVSSLQLRYRVTTAVATITWSEVAIAKGSIALGGNPTLTVVGWADTSAVNNSTGQKSVTVSVFAGQSIDAGDDLWAVIGNAATTAAVVRAVSIADDIQVGLQASLATRPSLNVGNGQAYTIEGATVLAPWIAAVL